MSPAFPPTPRTRDSIPVVAAVIQRDQRYLLCLRPRDKRHGGLWEFPGGKLEEGESPLEGLRRELREELGVGVTAVGDVIFSRADAGSTFVIHFHRVEIAGVPEAREHPEVGWFTPTQAAGLPLAPSDAAFVAYLAEAQDHG